MCLTVVATNRAGLWIRARARVAPTAKVISPVASRDVAWAIWLSIPVLVTVLAALVAWVCGRPAKVPTTDQAMRAHADYLDALVQTARSKDRGPHAPPPGR